MSRKCPKCSANNSFVAKYGHYYRRSDSKRIQRYKCLKCKKLFSSATFSYNYRQRKRRLNFWIFKLYCAETSQRRMAIILGTNRKTVARKLKVMQPILWKFHYKWLEARSFDEVLFDDLETSEHSKYKPLTVPILVSKGRKILGFEVGKIPAKGPLAKRAKKKYGYRPNEGPAARERLLASLKYNIHPKALFECDEHPNYPEVIKKHYPDATIQRYKSNRAAIIGQGELKKVKFDPLFKVNHTFAMMRAGMSRLIRKTWNTTKTIEGLEIHLVMYMVFHNVVLTSPKNEAKTALRGLFYKLTS